MGARYDSLPVYREAYDLIVYFNSLSVNLARDMRYTIAEDLKRCLIAVEVSVYRANAAKAGDKLRHIADAQDRMVEACLYLRLLSDCQQITLKQYALCAEKAVAIETHLGQWHRYYAEPQQSTHEEQQQV